MLIRAPPSLHYPITITSLLVSPKQPVQRSDRLFTYTYYSNVTVTNEFGDVVTERRSYPADFRAENDGSVVKWKIAKGDVIDDHDGVVFADFDEPCRHEIQFGGLCANCGKLMTEYVLSQVSMD
jgi:RNA polymerase II subunit A-like phosphatase